MEIVGNTYEERCDLQLQLWVEGQPIHNKVDDECCPDFSCCRSVLLATEEVRKKFAEANEETRNTMLTSFLLALVEDSKPGKIISIIQ